MERAKMGKIKWKTANERLSQLRSLSKDQKLLTHDDLMDLFATETVKRIQAAAKVEKEGKSVKKLARSLPPSSPLSISSVIGESCNRADSSGSCQNANPVELEMPSESIGSMRRSSLPSFSSFSNDFYQAVWQ
jgi:hypothetical protein